jgi:AAA domain-containing protein
MSATGSHRRSWGQVGPRAAALEARPRGRPAECLPFVCTSQYRAFAALCDARRTDRQLAIVTGPSGVGKTAYARMYAGGDGQLQRLGRYEVYGLVPCALLDHRRTLFIVVPRAASIKTLRERLCSGCALVSDLVYGAAVASRRHLRQPAANTPPGFRPLRRRRPYGSPAAPPATELIIVDDAEQLSNRVLVRIADWAADMRAGLLLGLPELGRRLSSVPRLPMATHRLSIGPLDPWQAQDLLLHWLLAYTKRDTVACGRAVAVPARVEEARREVRRGWTLDADAIEALVRAGRGNPRRLRTLLTLLLLVRAPLWRPPCHGGTAGNAVGNLTASDVAATEDLLPARPPGVLPTFYRRRYFPRLARRRHTEWPPQLGHACLRGPP